MPDQSTSDELLVRYLLDQVSDEERTEVEERFVADESFYRHLLLIEEELRSAYASGALPAEERRQFEQRFLIFEDEREKVEFEQALIAELATADVPQRAVPPVAARETRGWRERLLGLGSWPAAARLAAAAAAVVVALLSWQVYDGGRLRSRLSELEAVRAAREQETAQQARADRLRLDQIARDLEDERKARALL